MSGEDLEGAVRRYYGDPGVVAAYSSIVAEGLAPFEAALLRRAFSPGEQVLDVGCGAGREAFGMAREGLRVVAIDLVEEMARAAAAYAASREMRLPALAADVTMLPFRQQAFDGVAMLGQVITFVPGRDLRLAALRAAWRVLRPGGRLVMTTHNRRCHGKFVIYFAWVNRWRRLVNHLGLGRGLGDYDRWSSRDLTSRAASARRLFFHMYDLDEAVADLQAAGFEVLDARSRSELETGRSDPALRKRDYLLGFVARRSRGQPGDLRGPG